MAYPIPDWYARKPIAGVADIGTGGQWMDLRVSREEIDEYCALAGHAQSAATPPQGLVPTLARLSYLNGHRAPPGGVLARLRWTNHSALPTDGVMKSRSSVVADYEKRGRRRVEIGVELAHPDGRLIAETVWELVWPEGAR